MEEVMEKKELIFESLKKRGLSETFKVVAEDEDEEVILIESEQIICKGDGKILIALTKSFSQIIFCLPKLRHPKKKEIMLELFNSLNKENAFLTVYFDDTNGVEIRRTYEYDTEKFNGDKFLDALLIALGWVEDDYYDEIMKVMFA